MSVWVASGEVKKRRRKKDWRRFVRSRHRLLKGKDLLFLRAISACVLLCLLGMTGTVGWLFLRQEQTPEEAVSLFDEQTTEISETEIIREVLSDVMISGVISAGEGVRNALNARPAEITLSGDAASDFATIRSVRISGSDQVSISVASEGVLSSDDKYYYLFEEKIYEDGLAGGNEPLARVYKEEEFVFTTGLKRGTTDTRLFSRFLVAVKQGGRYQPISRAKYIENPEALASYSYGGRNHSSKKGLLIDPLKASTGEWDDLGIQYATYNFPLSHILGSTSNAASPTISYNYHGKTWYFNGAHIHQYDYLFSTLTNKGIDIIGIILDNASTSAYPEFTHPAARSGSTAPYYMFNGETADGVEALGAVATFLAGRYSGGSYGKVSSWIIGNEVNARKEWNYMASGTGLGTYTTAYAKAFRVFYNAIKSVNGAANVYICLDQQWDRNWSSNPDYDARDLLDTFAREVRESGDIDWGLAYHPYSQPLSQTAFWKGNSLVTNAADTSFITMNNLSVLTNYMHNDGLLTKSGAVRSIILSEQGYSSTSGQELQAAACAYAYKIAASNPDIDVFIYARETDHSVEIAQGLALGLNDTGGGHKRSYNVYKHVDRADSAEVCDFALGIIGISGWP